MKKFLFLATMLLSFSAEARFIRGEDVKYELNNTPYGEKVQLGTQLQSKKVQLLKALYNFNVQGGAVGHVDLVDEEGNKAMIPAGAIVKDCILHVLTPATSPGSASVAFDTGVLRNDLKDTTVKASLATPDSLVACTPVGTAASAIKMPGYTDEYSSEVTKEYTVGMSIFGAALDGGEFALYIEYILNR